MQVARAATLRWAWDSQYLTRNHGLRRLRACHPLRLSDVPPILKKEGEGGRGTGRSIDEVLRDRDRYGRLRGDRDSSFRGGRPAAVSDKDCAGVSEVGVAGVASWFGYGEAARA